MAPRRQHPPVPPPNAPNAPPDPERDHPPPDALSADDAEGEGDDAPLAPPPAPPETRRDHCVVLPEEAGQRLDCFLAGRFTYLSRQQWVAAIAAGQLRLNGAPTRPARRLQPGDELFYERPAEPEPPIDPDCPVLYDDARLLALNKSGNLPCHPRGCYFRHTLWYLWRDRLGDFHLLHRLDRETSGVVLIARDHDAARTLCRAFAEHRVRKEYRAIVHGELLAPVTASGFIVRDPAGPVRMKRLFLPADPGGGEAAETRFEPLAAAGGFTLLRVVPRTGRMHQIRATLRALGFPIVGDKLYGLDEWLFQRFVGWTLSDADRARLLLPRQALHAARLAVPHPDDGRELVLAAPLPPDLRAFALAHGLLAAGDEGGEGER